MQKYLLLIILILFLSIKTNAQKRIEFTHYTIKDSLIKERILDDIEKNKSPYENITYVECYVQKKKVGIEILLKFGYFYRILDIQKAYGVTLINNIPVFLCGKKSKIFKKAHERETYNIYSSKKYPFVLFEHKTSIIYIPD